MASGMHAGRWSKFVLHAEMRILVFTRENDVGAFALDFTQNNVNTYKFYSHFPHLSFVLRQSCQYSRSQPFTMIPGINIRT